MLDAGTLCAGWLLVPTSVAQRSALRSIQYRFSYVARDALQRGPVVDWHEEIKKYRMSYDGEPMEVALFLVLKEPTPGLFAAESCGGLNFRVDVASQDDWVGSIEHLYTRKLVAVLTEKKVFHTRGVVGPC